MHRGYHRWFSNSLGRDMELLVFGHAGARVLCFPPSLHPFSDWEDRGLVASIGGHIERDEDPLTGALREIREETGLLATDITEVTAILRTKVRRFVSRERIWFMRVASFSKGTAHGS